MDIVIQKSLYSAYRMLVISRCISARIGDRIRSKQTISVRLIQSKKVFSFAACCLFAHVALLVDKVLTTIVYEERYILAC